MHWMQKFASVQNPPKSAAQGGIPAIPKMFALRYLAVRAQVISATLAMFSLVATTLALRATSWRLGIDGGKPVCISCINGTMKGHENSRFLLDPLTN
jgi:hypothetical protein